MKNDDEMQASDAWQCLLPAFLYLHLLCILQKENLKTIHFGVILKKLSCLYFFPLFVSLRALLDHDSHV